MTDPKLPSCRALPVPAVLAAYVALVSIIVFVGEDIAHDRSPAKRQRAGKPGGVPRRPQP